MNDTRQESDAEAYRRRGYHVTPSLLNRAELEELREGVREVHTQTVEGIDHAIAERIGWAPGSPDSIRVNDYAVIASRKLRKLLDKSIIAETAAVLMGTDQVRVFQSGIVYKEPFDSRKAPTTIGWHTDRAYWRTCSSTNMSTAWIPLGDTSLESGTLEILEGSHAWDWPGIDELRLAKSFRELDVEAQLSELRVQGAPIRRAPILVRAGQMSFHHCLVFHGSSPNLSSAPRIAITLHFQDKANRYVDAIDEGGLHLSHSNDAVCRKDASGRPDYSDPLICPTLFTSPEFSP